ncbi:Zn-dependent exopeptidase [Rhizoclosmatium globosum]|uniref:Zn-dependent exopeptidase n=1 Tax=Rhizoclosmatium globosum TaxID=329046 RepID=A0A1Y2C2M5_9FUNG|nr:Zn-dependent exopeptidase [Rhizoclosmatium globosum]|eukprot:ORY41293.1 Zn-dependent exopeptidase [Rhizoclosmatium globosum]
MQKAEFEAQVIRGPVTRSSVRTVCLVCSAASCAQTDPRAPPPSPVLDSVFATQFSLANASYSNQAATRLAGLVRIRSESFDDMKTPPSDPDTDDPRRAGLVQIRDRHISLVHKHLNLEIVNYYGLVYTWIGSDSSLKPVMVTAHQDTVPVDTSSLDKWTFPPFEGRIENGYIWAQIVSIMDAVETLRGEITKHLEAKGYGNQQIEFILDEGSSVENQYGASFALLSTGERGYMDIEYSVRTIGGHSSIPPDHTAIGFLAKIISALEDHPYKPNCQDLNRSPSSMNYVWPIDIVSGGVKVNALPEVATAIGNYRIHIDESVKSTEERVLGLMRCCGSFSRTRFYCYLDDSLEPAPITPTTGKPFQLVAGTIRQAMVRGDEKLFVAPSLPTGNSDTRYFHSLSKHIFRFTALRDHDSHNIHTVDEKCKMDDLVQSAGFFFQLLRNVDQDVL